MWDTKKAILLSIGIYLFITLWAVLMDETYEFYILAVMIALVQGGIQALSRFYYAKMIPDEYAAEFFGFYNFLGKTAAILGLFLIGIVALITENSRVGIASVAIFFILGAILLMRVNEKKLLMKYDLHSLVQRMFDHLLIYRFFDLGYKFIIA